MRYRNKGGGKYERDVKRYGDKNSYFKIYLFGFLKEKIEWQ